MEQKSAMNLIFYSSKIYKDLFKEFEEYFFVESSQLSKW